MATAGSSTDPLGSGEPSGASFANNLTLLGVNQEQNQFAGPAGNAGVQAAQSNLNTAANYDLGILSGDRSKILATEAPEIGSILSSYDTARRAAGELTPRGGGRSETLNELPYKELGDVNKLIEKARPEAANDLSRVAGEQAVVGTSEQQLASSDVQNSLDFLLGKAGAQLNSAQLQGEQGASIGAALGQTAAQLIMLGSNPASAMPVGW